MSVCDCGASEYETHAAGCAFRRGSRCHFCGWPAGPGHACGVDNSEAAEGRLRDPQGMTRKEKYALVILEEGRGTGVLTMSRTQLIDGQAGVHWRTARSLERRGFVRIDHQHDAADDVVMV